MKYNLFSNPTFWLILGTFVVGGGNAVLNVIPPTWAAILSAALGLVAMATHVNTVKQAVAGRYR